MAAGDEDQRPPTRLPIKSHVSFNNYPKWKDKLRENCYKRVRADRAKLMWKMRIPDSMDHSLKHEELVKSTFQDIVSDELRKMNEIPIKTCSETLHSDSEVSDALWEYDGLHAAYEGECEEMLLEMQRIFYEDLKTENIGKEPDSYNKLWEDEEDEYLARAVFEHMQLNDNKVTLEILRDRLAEAHAEHFDRGCRLKPKFRLQSKFNLTALYMECHGCNTFEIVI